MRRDAEGQYYVGRFSRCDFDGYEGHFEIARDARENEGCAGIAR